MFSLNRKLKKPHFQPILGPFYSKNPKTRTSPKYILLSFQPSWCCDNFMQKVKKRIYALTGWLPTFNFKNPVFLPIFHTFFQPFCLKKYIIFQPRPENTYYFPAKKCNIFVIQQEVKPKEKWRYVINKQLFSHQQKIQLNAMQAGFYTQPKQINK